MFFFFSQGKEKRGLFERDRGNDGGLRARGYDERREVIGSVLQVHSLQLAVVLIYELS